MEQMSSFWKMRSTEKTLATDRKANKSITRNGEEKEPGAHEFQSEKAEQERDVGILDHKDIAKTQESNADLERAKAQSLKKDLDKALHQKAACEERLTHLDIALKERTQQLHFAREHQQKIVHSAMMKASHELEQTKIAFEERLVEADNKIARLDRDNAQLKKALSKKDKVVEELSRYRSQVEADLEALIVKLESTEKANASLKYEIRVLEREIEIRHEERENDRRTADAAQKQHRESVEKIAKLESECQRLRLLVRTRLPGRATLAKMKSEVEGPEKEQFETLKRKSNHSIDFLTEQLHKMEEENRILKLALNKKSSERGKYPFFRHEHSPAPLSELGSDDKTESWASPLISELEHFKNEKKTSTPSHRYMGTPDMNLMDDFAEMEKLAYSPVASRHVSQISEIKSLNLEASDTGNENNSSTTKTSKFQCNVSIPIQKILELLKRTNIISLPGSMVRVFRCETGELSAIVQQFIQACNELFSGEGEIEQFVLSVASNLEWIMNHCFSLQDVSSMKDFYGGSANNHSAESANLNMLMEEDKRFNIEPANKEPSIVNLEDRLQLLQDSKDIVENLQSETPTMRSRYEGNIEDRTEEQNMMKQDSETLFEETNLECSKPCEKISNPEKNLENANKSFKELQETCNDLKTQLEGETSKEVPYEGKQLQNDWEITSASQKLAECQETIRNLGKQLKALASPKEAGLFDKGISTPDESVITSMSTPRRNSSQRLSLLDKMLAEDDNAQIDASPITKDATQNGHDNPAVSTDAGVSMAIVPRKKKGSRSLLKKLIWWQKKGNSKKTPYS